MSHGPGSKMIDVQGLEAASLVCEAQASFMELR
eukprot:CAMPEP_0202348976 /NCGR_PEP_ID=MMETSP1126-20121109/6665_1 /ASSEMBLY_ACC=CAM_ASM_000457 /TAXON_ID=3047 /ORGANISM="Dunaliella tertiolecta, Strain CCMP1320" /LENGTH=32 /DNA_ID= /DNA_START= /DNA_END= /DNA_ORIENTATION=